MFIGSELWEAKRYKKRKIYFLMIYKIFPNSVHHCFIPGVVLKAPAPAGQVSLGHSRVMLSSLWNGAEKGSLIAERYRCWFQGRQPQFPSLILCSTGQVIEPLEHFISLWLKQW